MTPASGKCYKPASLDNYNIEDINSEDSTDEEDQPRKVVPAWAQGELGFFIYRSPELTYSDHILSVVR